MSILRDQIDALEREAERVRRKQDPTAMYARASRGTASARAQLRAAQTAVRRATTKRAHGSAAVRFRDWRPAIEGGFGAWLSGDRLHLHWIAHRGSYGRFVRLAVEAEGERGHIGGATFYDTEQELLEAKRAAGPAWRGESIMWAR